MKPLQDISTTPGEGRWSALRLPDTQDRLGCELKAMFDGLTAGPLPDRLLLLADALDDAFRRGELFESAPSPPPRRRAS